MFGFKKTTASDPHDEEIKRLINDKWGDFEQEVRNQVGHLEENYVLWRRRSKVANISLLVGLVAISGDEDVWMIELVGRVFGLSGWALVIIFILLLFMAGVSGWILWRWSKVNKEFNKALNPIVFDKAFAILGFAGQHLSPDSVSEPEITALLDHSELITENRNRYVVDDMVVSEYQGRPLFMSELSVQNVTGSGKNRRTKNIFHGILITHDLPKSLNGKTFVTTEGDKRGFGKMSWWRRWFKKAETPQETILEWNDFENTLHVATTDGTEARYILTPDFMADLYDWWIVRKGKIRLSFIADRFYVLYPDKRVKIGVSTVSLAEKDLQQYVLAAARPLWHMKKLMESTEARLRSWQ